MPSPTNQTALTAMVISAVPFTVTQSVSTEPNTLELWYTYTAQSNNPIGCVAYANIASGYQPQLFIYTGPASAPVGYHVFGSTRRSAYVPVVTGTTYLFKVLQAGGANPLGADLTFRLEQANLNTAPTSSMLSTEENSGFPTALISGTTDNTVYWYVPNFPRAVIGAILADGHLLCDNDDETLNLYSKGLVRQYTGQPYYNFTPQWVTCNPTTKFYLPYQPSFGAALDLRTLTSGGLTTADQWTLPANSTTCQSGAPSLDETIFYYGGGTQTSVHTYNLLTHAAGADLVGAVASHSIFAEILVLADTTILVCYQNGTSDYLVKHYDAAGATLNTYNFGTDRIHHLALAYDTPTTFWIWLHTDIVAGAGTRAIYRRIKVSDGTTVEEAQYDMFAGGPSQVNYATAAYASAAAVPLFGVEPTCIFFVTQQALTPSLTPPGTIIYPGAPGVDDPIRILRQAPHLWDGASGHRLTYPGFQLLVESGSPRDTDQPLTFTLDWSDDGGHTWSNRHDIAGSNLGQYKYRFWWRRLGQSRDRVFRVVNSDDAKIVLVEALLVPDPVEAAH